MRKFIKNNFALFILIGLEAFFFYKMKPDDLEFFFLFWGFIGLSFLLFNIFSVDSSGFSSVLGGMGNSNTQAANYANQAGALAEKQYETKEGKKRRGGFFNKTNVIYFIFFLLNAVAYVIVMPK